MRRERRERCDVYDHCQASYANESDRVPTPPPAVVEVVTVWHDGHVSVSRYCVPCMALCRQDTTHLLRWQRRGDRRGNGVKVRSERVTWLTTLVDGQVVA